MRTKDREIAAVDEIEDVIKKATTCRIGLADNGEPYVVPICFGYERNALYFHSGLEGRKVEIIKRNSRVCFEMDADVEVVKDDKACDWTVNYRSVMGVGRAAILQSDHEKSHGLGLIMKHYGSADFNFPKSRLDKTLVVRIDIENMTSKKSGYR